MVKKNTYQSVTLTRIFMKIVGLWFGETRKEQKYIDAALVYAVCAIIFAIVVVGVDLYHCLGDFYALADNLCIVMLLILILIKFGTFIIYRNLLLEIIHFAQSQFWEHQYNEMAAKIMRDYDKRGVVMIYTFTIIVYTGTFYYILAPILETPRDNVTEKVLPFRLWITFPYHSPYYEVTYIIQSLSTLHSGICTFCFDNFVCTFNIHVAAQFKILAFRIRRVADIYVEFDKKNKNLCESETLTKIVEELKMCIGQHLSLITFVSKIQKLFMPLLLNMILLSSVVICLAGFQLLAAKVLMKMCLYSLHFCGALAELLMYTWTSNDIIVQSGVVGEAAYETSWYLLPHAGLGKKVKSGLMMIILRSSRPCKLHAGPFAVMSLETFMGILSTSMSYFTLLRQVTQESG